jgi:hypothetical protein|tara:strand:- start:232 stop:960 length:729 start_codon:yes stop_codon:yes gene_type:complete
MDSLYSLFFCSTFYNPPQLHSCNPQAILLPELEREVNEGPDYKALRAVFLWRVVSEWYLSTLHSSVLNDTCADIDAHEFSSKNCHGARNFQPTSNKPNRKHHYTSISSLDPCWWSGHKSESWTPAIVFDQYVESAKLVLHILWASNISFEFLHGNYDLHIDNTVLTRAQGEFHVHRYEKSTAGDTLLRTYFHGGIDFRKVSVHEKGNIETCCPSAGSRVQNLGRTGPGVHELLITFSDRLVF